MRTPPHAAHFEATILVHLDAAYSLARWLIDDEAAAQDAVQEACLRALRFFGSMSGPNPKAWFMAVVRNTCMDWLRGGRRRAMHSEYDDELHGMLGGGTQETPESMQAQASDARRVHQAIALLPPEFREVIVLRELEEMSYKEISAIVKIPIGTVMSRISRGRDLLAQRLNAGLRNKAAP